MGGGCRKWVGAHAEIRPEKRHLFRQHLVRECPKLFPKLRAAWPCFKFPAPCPGMPLGGCDLPFPDIYVFPCHEDVCSQRKFRIDYCLRYISSLCVLDPVGSLQGAILGTWSSDCCEPNMDLYWLLLYFIYLHLIVYYYLLIFIWLYIIYFIS